MAVRTGALQRIQVCVQWQTETQLDLQRELLCVQQHQVYATGYLLVYLPRLNFSNPTHRASECFDMLETGL